MTEPTLKAFENAIRNPSDSNHLMVIKDVPRRVRVYHGATLIADSKHSLRVLEIGKSFYDPVFYVPESDLMTDFAHIDRTTHCPIKGDAGYVSHGGEEIGWVYREPIAMASRLAAHYAFWPAKVRVVEGE